ncbi:S8 family serine peptidase [Jannaschia sp. Os4]|uniref:phage tail tip lysozyme n=1 Tax=Jannaschia sp. Os4 TaxID=2807617 RepID=UPI001939A33A|nr:phage tail tip lysozyme [Jannaschia sp. Os4]MBM2577997.1 S8 family serine peptidase [Jannaschia sp. Os4]
MDPQLWEEIAHGAPDSSVEAIARLRPGIAPPAALRLRARFGPIVTARLDRRDILAVRAHPAVASLKAGRRLRTPDGAAPPHGRARAAPGGDRRRPRVPETGRGVVVGVIDYGCDFVHPAFRRPDGGTRLLALWDQHGRPAPGERTHLGYGRVLDRAALDAALAAPDPYAAAGHDPLALGSGHGTHVMDIAAGSARPGAPTGMAPEADLVFVHVASRGTGGRRNFGDSARVLEAVDFVLRTAGGRPCVLNISMGRHGGPHDGSTLIEQALDHVAGRPRTVVVQSAGNYRGQAIHAHGRLGGGGADALGWAVAPGDATTNELEIWYPGADRIGVTLTGPGLGAVDVPPGARRALRLGGRIVGRAYHRLRDPGNGDTHVNVFLYPSAPSGLWTVGLRGDRVRDGRWHAWIERDGRGTQQSRFVRGPVSDSHTCGTIAHGRRTLTCAALDRTGRAIASFSSAGPSRDGRAVPVIAAPGTWIRAARAGGPARATGGTTRKSGTSMAAPYVAGLCALMLQARPEADAAALRAALARTAAALPPDPPGAGLGSAAGAVRPEAALAAIRAASLHPKETDAMTPTLTQTQWSAVATWLTAGYRPDDGTLRLPPRRPPYRVPPGAVALPRDARGAALSVGEALHAASGWRGLGTGAAGWARAVLPAMPMDADDWRRVTAFLEREHDRNRAGTGPVRLGADAAAARALIARGVVAARFGGTPPARVDPKAMVLLRRSLGRAGPMVDWTMVDIDDRRRHAMTVLTGRHGLSDVAAAAIVGNLDAESSILPQRVEGSGAADPRAARAAGSKARRRFSARAVATRRRGTRGPRSAGVGLAQWTSGARRRGLFEFTWRGIPAGPGVLFLMDMQLAYLVDEMRRDYRGVWRRLNRGGVRLRTATSDVLRNYETPGSVLKKVTRPDGTKKWVRRELDDPKVVEKVDARTRRAEAALRAHRAAAATAATDWARGRETVPT